MEWRWLDGANVPALISRGRLAPGLGSVFGRVNRTSYPDELTHPTQFRRVANVFFLGKLSIRTVTEAAEVSDVG